MNDRNSSMRTSSKTRRISEAGFTLVEFLVVIGIAAVLFSILTLGIRRAVESFELRRAASTAVAEIRGAQAGALANHVDYVVEFGTSTAEGPPGKIIVFRPGVPVTGTVSATSSGASDTRSVAVVGIGSRLESDGTTRGVMVSDTLFLNGTATMNSSVAMNWILEVDTPQPNSCCTISIQRAATTLATIPPSQSSASLPWTQIRVVRVPDWPQGVRMDAGGALPFPLCSSYGSPWTGSTSRCLRFRALGYPEQAGEVLLCSLPSLGSRIVVAAGTGKVSVIPGTCP